MRADPDRLPRLSGDTARTFAATGLTVLIMFVLSFGYGLAAALNDLPLGGPVYATGGVLGTFIVFFLMYQWLTFRVWHRADRTRLVRWAQRTTPHTATQRRVQLLTGTGARAWALTAAALALVAVLAIALTAQLRTSPIILVLALLAVASSWSTVVFAYALAYLRADVDAGGLRFPEQASPVWADYFYLSLQTSTTFSSSDVDVTTTRMRRLVGGHTLIAFVFNTVIVALLVSLLLISAT